METRKKKSVFQSMLEILWKILTAIPGLAIFYWAVRERIFGIPLNITIKKLMKVPFDYGPKHFIPLEISFFNPNPFAVIVSEMSVGSEKEEGQLAVGYRAFDSDKARLLYKDVFTPHLLQLNLHIPPHWATEGGIFKTDTKDCKEIFFVSPDVLNTDAGQIKIRFKCIPTVGWKRKSKVVVKTYQTAHKAEWG